MRGQAPPAQCCQLFRIEKKLIALQNKEGEEHDDVSEAERLYTEDKRAHRLGEHAYGGDGNEQNATRTKKVVGAAGQVESMKTWLTITHDKEATPRQFFFMWCWMKVSEGKFRLMSSGKFPRACRMTGTRFWCCWQSSDGRIGGQHGAVEHGEKTECLLEHEPKRHEQGYKSKATVRRNMSFFFCAQAAK